MMAQQRGAKQGLEPRQSAAQLGDKLRTQRHITIAQEVIPGANHFFVNKMDQLMKAVDDISICGLDPGCPIR